MPFTKNVEARSHIFPKARVFYEIISILIEFFHVNVIKKFPEFLNDKFIKR